MTTEMKQLLALLLLGCVIAVHCREKGARKKDTCTQGWVAAEVFYEYRRCGSPKPSTMAGRIMRSIASNLTVQNLRQGFSNYCREVLPKMKQCFEANIENCTAHQQNTLTALIQHTGFFCEPNDTNNSTNSKFNYILNKLTDVDMATNRTCNFSGPGSYRDLCRNQSLQALNVSRANFNDYARNLSLEQLPASVQTYFGTQIECMVTYFRNISGQCPQWRQIAMMRLTRIAMPPILSFQLAFNTSAIDQMFDWPSQVQSRAVDPGPLFSWLM